MRTTDPYISKMKYAEGSRAEDEGAEAEKEAKTYLFIEKNEVRSKERNGFLGLFRARNPSPISVRKEEDLC